ncbi:MAB_1171c family putative transporter [Streptomyces mobaraensis]|uniref:DUF6545 domain-containing protein n=1 Tax=Streptomyces mobaraensis TaxID=35621 RepID=A0A5N5W451_STRMB|nr:MAB_1171c family putative transporter [Streptomyces mobaraensis]KAB7839486.1 hypothetical protein FRZ00_21335 [Streptomyces mobaraensis]
MSDVISYVIAGMLLLQAAWRAPAAMRGRARERSLWGTLTAMSLAWLMRTDFGKWLVDHVGVFDLATLLKHLLTVAALGLLFRYVTAIDAAEVRTGSVASRRIRITAAAHRYATIVGGAVSIAMTVVFLFWLHRTKVPTDPQFLERHAGEPAVALYMGLLYAFSGTVIGLCAYQWGSKANAARGAALRAGLWLMTTGMIIGVLYAAIRIIYSVLAGVHPVSSAHAAVQECVTDILLYGCFFLWGIGVVVPATQAARNRYEVLVKTVKLQPLWRDLAVANLDLVAVPPSRLLPGSRLAAPVNTARDVLCGGMSPAFRLGRYITEIQDAILELRRRAPEGLYTRALQMAERDGGDPEAQEARAQALWIRAALAAADRPAGQPVAFPSGRGESLAAEGAWLLSVAAAYTEVTPYAVVALLAEEGQPA